MKPIRIARAQLADAPLEGTILCDDVSTADGTLLRKGRMLQAEDRDTLGQSDWDELHVVALEPGEVTELAGGERVARAAAGGGVEPGTDPDRGHFPLVSRVRGVLDVDLDALARINAIDGLSLYTHRRGRIVEDGEVVARAKVLPFAVAEAAVAEAEAVAAGTDGVVAVRGFDRSRVALVVQETVGTEAAERVRTTLVAKLEWLGSTLIQPSFVSPHADEIVAAVRAAVDAGADIVLVAGTRALDPLDPAFDALARLDAPLERFGMPAHPGSFLWFARVSDARIVGVPSCGLFSRATAFDAVLPRLLAGTRPAEIAAEIGHGGFLDDAAGAELMPPYRHGAPRGTVT